MKAESRIGGSVGLWRRVTSRSSRDHGSKPSLMQLGQFSASVFVAGVKLSEYSVQYSPDGKEVTCWVPSEDGKQFRVEWTNTRSSASRIISGLLSVDGISCGGKRMRHQHSGISKAARDSVASSATTRRQLMFGKQTLTDNDDYLNAPVSPHLGTISLDLRRVKDLGTSEICRNKDTYTTNMLHERSKKAVGHSVQFGGDMRSYRNTKRGSVIVEELVNFVFKYRPIELLQAQGIAPPAQRQERAVLPSDLLDLTVDAEDDEEAEIEELEARLGALKNKRRKVKRESSDVAVKKEVKSEERFVPTYRIYMGALPKEAYDLEFTSRGSRSQCTAMLSTYCVDISSLPEKEVYDF
ncbi:hypothetical protein K438DRAFT_2017799 [Mycena galopus ATCC 62051]|nr:hypothetical protein K438DRAFT_2017799 [Mycena galopus ATCC 62051]